jgi:hypothetical protein
VPDFRHYLNQGDFMIIEKLFPSGDYLITDMVNGNYIKMRYNGYTKKEAIKLFKEYCKTL